MRKILASFAILTLFSLTVLGTAYIDAFLLEPNWLKIERVRIPINELADCLGGLTLVQLSDCHLRGPRSFLERQVIDAASRIRPDIIFISGDFVSRRFALDDFWRFASELQPGVWIYGVPGDDDIALINDKWEDDGWRQAGMSLLVDEIVPVVWREGGERIWLVGAGTSFDWAKAREKLPPAEPVIVLSHRPVIVKDAAVSGVEMVLAGDTHGTQVGIEALRDISPYARRGPYVAGLYKVKDTFLYVNRGMGWKARPVRFFCRPELTVFSFVPADAPAEYEVLPGDE